MNWSLGSLIKKIVIATTILSLQACVMPTVLKPNSQDLSIYRNITYDSKTPDDMAVNSRKLAQEIAENYPFYSQYRSYQTSATYTGSTSCIGDCGSRESRQRATGRDGSGVTASASENTVTIRYVKRISNSSGTGETITQAIINISEIPDNPGNFTLSVGNITEEVGIHPGLGFAGIEPLAPINQIAEDITQTLEQMPLNLTYTFNQKIEFRSPYPATSVLANYERHLGSPVRPVRTSTSGTLEAFFSSPTDMSNRDIKISIAPYRSNESVVEIDFSVTYQLLEGGGNTFSQERIQSIENMLRQIAFD